MAKARVPLRHRADAGQHHGRHSRSFARMVAHGRRGKDRHTGMKASATDHFKSGAVEPMDCLYYSLNVPVAVLITGIDKHEILEQAFAAVKPFSLMNEAQIAALIAKTERRRRRANTNYSRRLRTSTPRRGILIGSAPIPQRYRNWRRSCRDEHAHGSPASI